MNADADMAEPDRGSACAAWLAALPADATIAWHADGITADHPYVSGWVDVCCPPIQHALDLNWIWTVHAPGDEGDGEGLDIAWAPDLDVYAVTDDDGRLVGETTAPAGSIPDGDCAWLVADWITQTGGAGVALLEYYQGWSINAVNAALGSWAASRVGRGDLRFTSHGYGGPYRRASRPCS